MLARPMDFNRFGDELWEMANVFRDDALHATERLETFSLFLFLKLWDEIEMDVEAARRTKVPEHQAPIPDKYRFHRWASDPDAYAIRNGFKDSIDFCRHMFADLAVRESDSPMARDVRRLFKDTVFRLRYPSTVQALASQLQELDIRAIMSRRLGQKGDRFDVFGRAYEYLLQQFGQNKEFAEYFTPRHIVDRMVQIVDPGIGERIYDPACGTGGFIVRAFEHVRDRIFARELPPGDEEDSLHDLKEKSLFGVEHVPLVFKLALMNMVLHRDGSANLENGDSLSSEAQEEHRARYDVILANPPFGPTKQERLAQFEFHIRLYEALFIQHMMHALRPGGRAAVVVKEGLLFDSRRMLRSICKKLVEDFQLLGVISLPNGVFNPYSGAKTSILIFRRPSHSREERTNHVWFYRVDSDGRDLGATRRPLPDFETDGDLAHLASVWPYRWDRTADSIVAVRKSADFRPSQTDRSWWASLDDIRRANYNLTAGHYSPREETPVEYEKPQVLINKLLDLESEIATNLEDLLTLVTVPTTTVGLRGSFRFSSDEERADE